MDLLSSLNSHNCAYEFRQVLPYTTKFYQILPQWLNRLITIFHPQDGKSPLAHLVLAPWLLAQYFIRARLDTKSI